MAFSFKEAATSALNWAKSVANSDTAITALNAAKYLTKSGTYSYSRGALDKLSAKERAAAGAEFSASVGLDGEMPAAVGFTTYATQRINTVDKFTEVKVNGKALPELLKVTSESSDAKKLAVPKVTDDINKALEFSQATKDARKRFEEDMGDLKKCLVDPAFNYLPSTLTTYLFEVRGHAVTALKEQQAQEIKNLETLFAEPAFCSNLQTSVGLTAAQEDEFKQVKDDMMSSLKKSQAQQLDAFEKSVNGPLTKMLDQSKTRVAFLAMAYRNDKNRAAIDGLRLAKGNLTTTAGSASTANSDRFKDVKIEDLKQIMTASGRELTSTGEHSYALSLPNRLLRPDFYASSSNNRKEAIMMMPLALKAQGCDTVTMTINHPNKDYAKELAREAYEACREAGFETKDIKIVMNDEVFSEEKTGDLRSKLFSDCGSRFDAAEVQAKKNATDWEEAQREIDAQAPRKSIPDFKATIKDCRDTQDAAIGRAEAEAAAAAAANPSAAPSA